MDIGHIILGRPWQFDNNTLHDEFSNKITFSQNNQKYILFPLSPAEVRVDTIHLKKKIEQENISHRYRFLLFLLYLPNLYVCFIQMHLQVPFPLLILVHFSLLITFFPYVLCAPFLFLLLLPPYFCFSF